MTDTNEAPQGAPETVIGQRGPKGGWMFFDKKERNSGTAYTRKDIADKRVADARNEALEEAAYLARKRYVESDKLSADILALKTPTPTQEDEK